MLSLEFFRCLGAALVANGLPALIQGNPLTNFLVQVAGGTLERWRRAKGEAALRAAVEEVARQGVDDARAAAAEVAREVGGGHPAGVEQAVELYLSQLPAALRRSLASRADPTGTTVPAGVVLDRPDALARLLPQALPRFREGDRPACLDGRWELVALLGSGGFGEVWQGRHVDSPSLTSAFKFCLDPHAQDRLLRHEQAVLTQVQKHGTHPGIVPLIDFDLRGDAPWLRYEYVPGGDLTRVFPELHPLPTAGRVARVVPLLRDLAGTVGHFHRLTPAVVHRDLKPANVLLAPGAGGGWACRVADFGIGNVVAGASAGGAATPDVSGLLTLGQTYTAVYAAPQQKRGLPPDPRDDVYALGVIAYQLLTADPGAEVGPDFDEGLTDAGVPADLVRLIKSCVAHDPAKRPADAADLAARLATCAPATAPTKPDAPNPQPKAAPTTPPVSSGAEWYWVAAGLVAAVLLIAVIFQSRRPSAAPTGAPVSAGTVPAAAPVPAAAQQPALLHTITTFPGGDKSVGEAWLSPDGKRLLIVNMKGVDVWDTTQRRIVGKVAAPADRWFHSARLSADGARLITSSTGNQHPGWNDYNLDAWDVMSGTHKNRMDLTTSSVGFVFSDDGSTVSGRGGDGAYVAKTADGSRIQTFSATFRECALSPDGQWLLNYGQRLSTVYHQVDDPAELWDTRTGTKKHTLKAGNILKARFDPSGKRLLTLVDYANRDTPCPGTLWDVATGAEVGAVNEPDRDRLAAAALGPGGTWAVVADTRNIAVRAASDGRLLTAIKPSEFVPGVGQYNPFNYDLHLSPAGDLLVTVERRLREAPFVAATSDNPFGSSGQLVSDPVVKVWHLPPQSAVPPPPRL